MTQQKKEAKAGRMRYSAEFKEQALQRAVKDGVPAVAQDLGLAPTQLYAWRARAQQRGQDDETQRLIQAETARLKREVARLEEENAFLKKAAAYSDLVVSHLTVGIRNTGVSSPGFAEQNRTARG